MFATIDHAGSPPQPDRKPGCVLERLPSRRGGRRNAQLNCAIVSKFLNIVRNVNYYYSWYYYCLHFI